MVAEAALRLPERIRAIVGLDPDAPALQFGGRWLAWSAYATAIDGVDAVLTAHGFGPHTRIGVVVRNRPEVVRAFVAVLGTERCIVTLSSVVPEAVMLADVAALRLPVIVAAPSDWTDDVIAAVEASGALGLTFADDDAAPTVVVEPTTPADRETAHDRERPGVAVQMLTSGTTGTPKRVDLAYRSLELELTSTASYSARDIDDVKLAGGCVVTWSPLLHVAGLRALVSNLVVGRRIALLERFDVVEWCAAVIEHRPKAVSLVPSALRMVLDADVPVEVFDSIEAVVSGTAPLSAELAEEFERRYDVAVLPMYGATEFAGGVAGWTAKQRRQWRDAKRGSVGTANRGIEVRTVDPETGLALPLDAVGLLEVRGAQTGHNDWVRTTDLARIDADGFIWITGRADDVIIRGGYKVSTTKVADLLRSAPGVHDACVIGVPDERLGQRPVAAIELDAGGSTGLDEIEAFAREWLTPYEVPARFVIVDRLPRTASMKVSQPEVRQLFD